MMITSDRGNYCMEIGDGDGLCFNEVMSNDYPKFPHRVGSEAFFRKVAKFAVELAEEMFFEIDKNLKL